MGVGAVFYMYGVVVKSSRALSGLLVSSCSFLITEYRHCRHIGVHYRVIFYRVHDSYRIRV